jgi:hypothetical protein
MGNLPPWAGSITAAAVGLAPGLLVLSTRFIGRLLLRVAEMFQPKAEQRRRQQITNHDLPFATMSANESDVLEPDGDRLAVRHHLHRHSPKERLTELVD